MNQDPSLKRKLMRPKILVPAGAALAAAALWLVLPKGPATDSGGPAYFTAERGNFTIALPTGGSLEAVNEVSVHNRVPGQTRIISLIKEGTLVKEGELLLELDSADIENQLSVAEIAYHHSLSTVAELEEKLETMKSENVIRLRDADLAVKLAKQDLVKYKDGQWPQLRKKAESAITLSTEELRRAQERLNGTRRLEEKGYATPTELIADQLVVQRREIELQSAKEDLRLLVEFDYPRQLKQLEANAENTEVRYDRTIRQNETQLEKLEAQMTSARETLALRKTKLEELREAREHTRIYAPQDGLVVYQKAVHWRQEPIEEGSNVRERQQLISLPDVSTMKVRVNIYESQISLVKPGMRAYIHLDALPDQRFSGEVLAIETMPEPSRDNNPNHRVYKAEVLVNEALPDIKPGVTARVDVLVAELEDVIKVPLQAVVGIEERQFCFVRSGGSDVPVEVEVGLFDSEFVQIRSGLMAGDEVALAPPATTRVPDASELRGGSAVKPESATTAEATDLLTGA